MKTSRHEARNGARGGRWWQVLGVAVAVVCGLGLLALAVLAWWPGAAFSQWASTQWFVAHGTAFPTLAGLTVLVVSAVVLGLALRLLSRSRSRVAPWFAVAALPGLLAGVGLAVFPAGPPWSAGPHTVDRPGPGQNQGPTLSVATYNSLGSLTASDLERLESEFQPDLLVLPETSHARAQAAVDAAGWPGTAVTHGPAARTAPESSPIEATTVLLRDGLPEYTPAEAEPSLQGTVRLEPTEPGQPLVLGVHYAPPLPGFMSLWRDDLSRSVAEAEEAAQGGPVVLVGDFNATMRHGALAGMEGLVDTARACGRPQGTWPTGWPPVGRSAIDHVIVTEGAQVLSCRTLQLPGSDHLAYAAEVRF
ncbi:endonuclease/exonuclease/phosphatase family protein [Kytococcus sedentarius]|uniref:endonuclease/exonuclease/phosphatase family protein n=1 Tax=Kytococcus sedentarius TaxID=1276 RepID=UPI00194E4781|nr:endonuclease/exonuclease/phosphatase family protein [Kytococcus sedentarius]QRO88053.1 endonuclease/exonuclease/phosphatase family protein [Kytococcus sedentarius]